MAALPALRCRISHLWVKLSNYGEILKLLVPSHLRKYLSGWINYSETVTSQKMTLRLLRLISKLGLKTHNGFSVEREMNNRVSKSITGSKWPTSHKPVIVKEQRVDDSWHGVYSPCLRYTLMDFERNYPIKVLSNQKRFYTTNDSNHLNPFFCYRICWCWINF